MNTYVHTVDLFTRPFNEWTRPCHVHANVQILYFRLKLVKIFLIIRKLESEIFQEYILEMIYGLLLSI